ncbi:MAG: MarR family transcriptional regulator [Nocardioides sp.]|uniref:MarR family winged helix-turn-helix transcriptional regulator n=1 Tax=Nocardioides sp. TaxID=35761 RepID=UPI0039E2A170
MNTVSMLGAAYSLLGFDIVDGVVGSGFPIKPHHSAVFGQIRPEGMRLTDLARGANITPQSMGKIVDELEQLGYVVRTPDPVDRRAKLIKLTKDGAKVAQQGATTIQDIEERLVDLLGERDYRKLRATLVKILSRPEGEG